MIKTLAKSIREYKKQTILTPIFMVGEVGMEISIPFLLSILIDQGINNHDMSKIILIGICLVVASFLSLLFGRLGGKTAATAASGFAKNLRQDMFEKVQEFSFFNIDKFSTSSIVTRLTSDVSNVQMAFMLIIRGAIRSPITIIFALIMTFAISPKMGLIYLIATPILLITLLLLIKFVHPVFKRVFKTIDKLNRVVQENVNAIRVVKSFVTEEREIKKFNEVSDNIYNDFSKAEKIMAFNGPVMQLTIYTCLTLISWFGAKFVVGGELTTGQLTSLFTYVMQLLMNLMMLSMIFVMIIISLESGQRISEIIEEEPDLKNPENPVMKVDNGNIEFKNVCFSYVNNKDREVLKNINLKINSGETVGILGGTGDGKSSLVNLIPRLYDTLERRSISRRQKC